MALNLLNNKNVIYLHTLSFFIFATSIPHSHLVNTLHWIHLFMMQKVLEAGDKDGQGSLELEEFKNLLEVGINSSNVIVIVFCI